MLPYIKKFKYELLIALVFVLTRLPGLGHDGFNTDVWKWKTRSYDFSTGVFTFQPAKTLQKYHPGVTLMWAGTFGVKVANLITETYTNFNELQKLFLLDTVQKVFVMLLIATTLSFIFYVLKTLFSLRYAVLATSLLTLEPFYIALTRQFHLEGLLSSFMLASALWLYYFLLDKEKTRRLAVSAVFAGLAILTKTNALYLVLFAGLLLLHQVYMKRSIKEQLVWYLKWLSIIVLTCAVVWPAVWASPLQVYNELVRGVVDVGVDSDHIQYYFGKLVSNPGPFFYLTVLALRSSVYTLVGLIGLVIIFKKLERHSKAFVLFLLTYTFFYLLEITIPGKKLDRYILPSITALVLCSAFFWDKALDYFFLYARKFTGKYLYFIVYFTFFTPVVVANFVLHPDYLSFYNPLFGGLKTGIHIIEPKWLIGQQEIVSYFINLKMQKGFVDSGLDKSLEEVIYRDRSQNVLIVGFQEKYYTQIWPFFREFGAWAVIQDISAFAQNANYFVYPVWDDRAKDENRFVINYVATISKRGVPIYNVYERIR